MKFLVLLASVLSSHARAEGGSRYENHLGGVYDREERRYVPGSGSAAPLGARTLATPVPVDRAETYSIYSRGNDDVLERDEAGVSNFETARIRVSALARPRAGGGHNITIRYVATLATDEEQAAEIGARFSLVCGEDNLGVSLRPAPVRLALQRPPGGSARGARLTAELTLGGATADGNYQGRCTIAIGNGERQIIRWRATVAAPAEPVITIAMTENDAGGGRRGADILRLIESNQNPRPVVAAPFPPRTGRARGPAQFGTR